MIFFTFCSFLTVAYTAGRFVLRKAECSITKRQQALQLHYYLKLNHSSYFFATEGFDMQKRL